MLKFPNTNNKRTPKGLPRNIKWHIRYHVRMKMFSAALSIKQAGPGTFHGHYSWGIGVYVSGRFARYM